jgi:hypothetical protein
MASGCADCRFTHRLAQLRVESSGGGALLDDLLVAALQGALALAEVDRVAVARRQNTWTSTCRARR